MKFFVNLLLSFCISSAVFAEKASDVFVGQVPIGGMVAIMPSVTGSWQPPASGVIKNGFMRADGAVVPSGQGSPLAGKTLPNMIDKYLRGDTSSGGTGGSNTEASNVTVSTQPEFKIPNHQHTYGLSIDINHDHPSFSSIGASISFGNSGQGQYNTWKPAAGSYVIGGSEVVLGSHAHTVDVPALGYTPKGVGGYIGSGVQADQNPFTIRYSDVSLLNTPVNNEPSYIETVWVIRVK